MSEFSRRDAPKGIGATAISAATGSLLDSPPVQAADLSYKPEDCYAGKLGTVSAGVMADYIVVNMFAEAASGASSIKSAIEQAESRAKRYYR